MNDCTNAEMRDRLPDLVHDRLSAGDLTIVLAHVEICVDCRDEVQLLRDAKAVFARGVPRVDIAYVVGALPKTPAPHVAARVEPARRPRVWNDWRIAAAVTLLIAGGGSYAVMSSRTTPSVVDTTVAMSEPATPDIAALVAPDDDSPDTVGSMDTRIGDLNEEQLNALLDDMDNLRAVPASEPDPVSLRADGSSALEGT